MESTRRTRTLILGGGFAGLTVAMELEKKLGWRPSVEITLVNRENFFLFTPMLHEVAASDLDLTIIVNPAWASTFRDSLRGGSGERFI